MRTVSLVVLLALLSSLAAAAASKARRNAKPNIILVVLDDEDVLLGSFGTQTVVQELLVKQGAQFTNAFCTTPVCCPSRSSILTGTYVHNTQVLNNTAEGGCQSYFASDGRTVGSYLLPAGYITGFFGKYLNKYSDVSYIPPGWIKWYTLIGSSVYYNYTISNQGIAEVHGDDYEKDYLVNVLSRATVSWINSTVSSNPDRPFFAYINPPAPHRPATPAPQYADQYANWTAPRYPSFNVHCPDKHWMIRATTPMNDSVIEINDELYRDRLRTLKSVDDMMTDIVNALDDAGVLDNTYIVYTSDHGYHVGQFGLQGEKRQPYEEEMRVPLVIRGPGIRPGTNVTEMALLLDVVPTVVDLAGAKIPPWIDGTSLVPTLKIDRRSEPSVSVVANDDKNEFNKYAMNDAYDSDDELAWRHDFLIEYWGQAGDTPGSCWIAGGFMHDCANNTYTGLRILNSTMNIMYAEFVTGDREMYDINKDPYQLKNIVGSVDPAVIASIRQRMHYLMKCTGQSCKDNNGALAF